MILPITYGGGSNLKTPEALLTGHPIIATARAFRGFEAFADMPGVIIAETVDAFSAAMRRVLSGEVPAPRHDKRLDSLVWDRTLQPIINLVRRLAPAHGSVDAVQTGLDDNHEADEFAKALPAAEAKIDSTDIELMGSPAIVYGCLDDDYFTKLPSYAAQNALFVAEAMKLPRDGVIMDVGANLGITTIIGSRCVPHGRVVAIEPSPRAYECLIRTVAANDLANCTVINKCLGETGGLVAFVETPFIAASHVGLYTAAGSDGNEADPFLADSHAGADRGPPVRIMTPITTIDAVVAELSLQRLDLIKIDVEGFELDVLKGASQAIRRLRPRFVMEFNSFLLVVNRNVSPRRLLDFVLARFGSFSTERNGVTTTISTASQAQDFLYSNMTTQHCVDDIAFGG